MLLTGGGGRGVRPFGRDGGGRLDRRLPWPERAGCVRRWRRTRPFWGGLLLMLGGAELLLVPLSPLTVLVSLGLGGLAALGIGLALMVGGALPVAAAAHATTT